MFYSSLTALIIHPFYISFLFLHKTLMARNGLLCADVPLRNYSINLSSINKKPFIACIPTKAWHVGISFMPSVCLQLIKKA